MKLFPFQVSATGPPRNIDQNLSNIIQARMEEIIEMAHAEIISQDLKIAWPGHCHHRGGFSTKLFEATGRVMTGMDTRIGYPNEHLARALEAVKSLCMPRRWVWFFPDQGVG